MNQVNFESIYSEHKNYVRGTVRKIGLRFYNLAISEDVEQEVWLSLHLQLKRGIDNFFNPRIWLNMVIRRKFIDLSYRAKTSKNFLVPMLTLEETAGDPTLREATLWEKVPSKIGCPESENEKRELRRNIHRTLREMSPRHRRVLVLREVHGLSYKEIGKALHMNGAGVETLIWRARQKFRKVYAVE